MGVWGQMPDGTAIHIDFAVKKNCWNTMAMCYGNCYGCGCFMGVCGYSNTELGNEGKEVRIDD